MSKKMLKKSLIGILIIACVLPPILLGGIPMELLIAFVAFFSAYETASLRLQIPNYPRTVVLFVVIEIIAQLSYEQFPFACALLLVMLFVYHFLDESFSEDDAVYTFIIVIILVLACQGIFRTYDLAKGLGMLYVAIACYACDTGAYFFGSFFGKHKMAPKISPNKTWEGAVGGYAAGALLSWLFGHFFCPDIPADMLIAGSLILPAVAEVGDLVFSSIKRRFGIKDFGSLLPGHGGVLDRVDSLLFCLMIYNGLILLWGM